MNWSFANKYVVIWTILAGAVAALAALARNIQAIVKLIRSVRLWWVREPFDDPILLLLQETRLDPKVEAPTDWENTSTRLDITISYEGDEVIVFDAVEIRHWPGLLLSVATGQLFDKAKYQFHFSYNAHEKYPLNPPLVLNPHSESLLKFQLELIPEGDFASTGGEVYTKLRYRSGKGRVGVLPLMRLDADDYRDYPEIYNKILQKGTVEFPKFESQTRDNFETFALTKTHALKGKSAR